ARGAGVLEAPFDARDPEEEDERLLEASGVSLLGGFHVIGEGRPLGDGLEGDVVSRLRTAVEEPETPLPKLSELAHALVQQVPSGGVADDTREARKSLGKSFEQMRPGRRGELQGVPVGDEHATYFREGTAGHCLRYQVDH